MTGITKNMFIIFNIVKGSTIISKVFQAVGGRRFTLSSSINKKPLPNNLITPSLTLSSHLCRTGIENLFCVGFFEYMKWTSVSYHVWCTQVYESFGLQLTIICRQKCTHWQRKINSIPWTFSRVIYLSKYLGWNMGRVFLWYFIEYVSGILSRAIVRNQPLLMVVSHPLLLNTKGQYFTICWWFSKMSSTWLWS